MFIIGIAAAVVLADGALLVFFFTQVWTRTAKSRTERVEAAKKAFKAQAVSNRNRKNRTAVVKLVGRRFPICKDKQKNGIPARPLLDMIALITIFG